VDDARSYEGGCLCGALRYRARGGPADAGYCHCRICQRSSGAPVLAWASFPREEFRYTTGTPVHYASSDHGQREFCGRCGTQICYRDLADQRYVDVNVATLDAPEAVEPRQHIWTDSRIRWFDTADDAPRYPQGRADD
jgi:hypothetical protein